jgi:hemerythrin superfamily protein
MAEHAHDVIEVLTHDHHELNNMLGELTAAADLVERRRILDRVTLDLVCHAVVEETHLYPVVRRHLPSGDEIVDKKISENVEVERLLREIQKWAAADSVCPVLIRQLIGDVSEHMQDEENALFPQLAEHASPQDLRRLGELVESAMDRALMRSEVPARARERLTTILKEGRAGTGDRRPDDETRERRETQPKRPRTPRDPDPNDHSSMWPDLWAGHRC